MGVWVHHTNRLLLQHSNNTYGGACVTYGCSQVTDTMCTHPSTHRDERGNTYCNKCNQPVTRHTHDH
jgi:hypothetical protein